MSILYNFEGWTWECSMCYWAKKQIEPFSMSTNPSNYEPHNKVVLVIYIVKPNSKFLVEQWQQCTCHHKHFHIAMTQTLSFTSKCPTDLTKWLAMINLGENCMSESLGPFFALPVALTTQQFKYWQIEPQLNLSSRFFYI